MKPEDKVPTLELCQRQENRKHAKQDASESKWYHSLRK